MKRISVWIRRLLQFIVTGSFALVLAACYGMPVNQMYDYLKDKRVRCTTGYELGIPGLEVTVTTGESQVFSGLTDEEGFVEFSLEDPLEVEYTLHVEDVDGEEYLGDFVSETAVLDSDETEYTIVMTEKE
ncbi:MAG: hypothetical protein ACLFR1_11275 [Spirochaetia bacterium]